VGEGFRAGWAHLGVLVRIALLYLAATIGSGAVLVAPCVIAMRAFGAPAAVVFGVPAFLIAVPWLVTLYLVQAFAWRIAVLENRQALDAIRKARLSLRYGAGLNASEIGAAAGIDPATIRKTLERARARLGDRLETLLGSAGGRA
jgi:hypothetical protein